MTGMTEYTYDAANRLVMVDTMPYTWDANGNLLNDGTSTYAYNHANRLTGVTRGAESYAFTYNGLGDRLSQTANGAITQYSLDIASGLTQVLADGTNTYLYGLGRIAQQSATTAYFHGDALGSVRQMTDANGEVVLANAYHPYGESLSSAGEAETSYGFTGEWRDAGGLIHLRARYYTPSQGRFLSRDAWEGDYSRPMSYNAWLYGFANPVRYVDPTGYISQEESGTANQIYKTLIRFGVKVQKDWGTGYDLILENPWLTPVIPAHLRCGWFSGNWRALHELELVTEAVVRTTAGIGGITKFRSAMGHVKIARWGSIPDSPAFAPPGFASLIGDIVLPDYHFDHGDRYAIHGVVHEFGHVWDSRTGWQLSSGMKQMLKTEVCREVDYGYGQPVLVCRYDVTAGMEVPVGNPRLPYPNNDAELILPRDIQGPWEDWADSFAVYVYPDYYRSRNYNPLGPIRRQYIDNQIKSIP
jgi:RHS repeat-associated protein